MDSVVNMEASYRVMHASVDANQASGCCLGAASVSDRSNEVSSRSSENSSDHAGIMHGTINLSGNYSGGGKTSATTAVSTMGLDDLSFDVLTQIEAMEAQARQNIEQKKSISSADLAMSTCSTGSNSIAPTCAPIMEEVTCDVPNFDLTALDALEKSALQDISKKKQLAGEAETVPQCCDDLDKNSIIEKRLIALSVSNRFNSVTGQREKLIRCIPSG